MGHLQTLTGGVKPVAAPPVVGRDRALGNETETERATRR